MHPNLVAVAPDHSADELHRAFETFTDEGPLDEGEPLGEVRAGGSRYQEISKLGQGGSGDVLLAMDRDIGRRVAIKRFRPTGQAGTERARFRREVHTIGRLEHPHIVPIHDVGRDEQGYFFVMRWVQGETLEKVIQRLRDGDRETHARYSFAARCQIVLSLISAVSYAHAQGIVHRDIKPANVMIGVHGEVQLLDWGIAEHNDAPARLGAISGSPAYMAPEQAAGQPVDERSDVYALGVLLHELLTLEHYLGDVQTAERMLEVVQTRPVPFAFDSRSAHQPRVPIEFAYVVKRATGKLASDRFASADLLAADLQAAVDGDFACVCVLTWQKWLVRRLSQTVDEQPLVLPALLAMNAGLVVGLAGTLAWVWH